MNLELFDALGPFAGDLPRVLQWDMLVRIVFQILLFSASAFFSGSETALFSLSEFDFQQLDRTRSPFADTLHSLLEQPRRLIVSILCGNELVNIAAAANMTAILVELVGIETAALIATLVMIPLILLLGEVTPKTLAVRNPVWASTRIVATPMRIWVRIVTPLALVVRAVADRTTTLIVGPERTKQNILHVEDLRTLIEEGVELGEISPTERALVQSLIRAGSTEVREIMTPRTRVAFVNGALDDATLRHEFLKLKRARAPVFLDHRDNVIGFLYVEDVLADTEEDGVNLRSRVRPALAVSPTREVDEMLDFFEQHKERAALVVNEHGGVDGIVTLSDVTRYLFAGVFEEAEVEKPEIAPIDGAFELDGGTPLSELRRATGLDLRDPSMTTVAGVVLRQLGRLPSAGDRIEVDGHSLTVLEMDNFRIHRIRFERTPAPSEEGPESNS